MFSIFYSSKLQVRTLIVSLLISGNAIAQDFPDALALLEFLHGAQSQKVPAYISSEVEIVDLVGNNTTIKASEYFRSGTGQFIIYHEGIGFNGQINEDEAQKVILRNELVYESNKINIENFLLFGLFKNNPQSSLEILRRLGIDTKIVRDAIRLGRTMWVIGAVNKDPETPQLWIDKKYLAVRKIHYQNLPQGEIQQMEFEDFIEISGFYIPASMEIKKEPVLKLRKNRFQIRKLDILPDGPYKEYLD